VTQEFIGFLTAREQHGISEWAHQLLREYRRSRHVIADTSEPPPYSEFPNELDYSNDDQIGGGMTIEEIIERWKTRGTDVDAQD